MRLAVSKQQAISQVARAARLPGARVGLFGSRVDDNARGGDIDLPVELPTSVGAVEWVARRQDFVAGRYRLLGERRIDVVLAPPGTEPVSPVVLEDALGRWRVMAAPTMQAIESNRIGSDPGLGQLSDQVLFRFMPLLAGIQGASDLLTACRARAARLPAPKPPSA